MMEVTPEEKDLIESIRNYNKSFPDGYPNYSGLRRSCSTICFDNPTTKAKPFPPQGKLS